MISLKNTAQIAKMREAGKILARVNNQICSNNSADMFVTVWMAILEISTGKITASNAGHEFPVIRTAGGDFEFLRDKIDETDECSADDFFEALYDARPGWKPEYD